MQSFSSFSIPCHCFLGLNHDGTILCSFQHREWALQTDGKWQTVNLETYIVQEQRGFICERNAIRAEDICIDTEQNDCTFENYTNEIPETVLVHIYRQWVCMLKSCL